MLKLTGASNIWIAADKLVGQSEYTVTGVRLPADGNDFQIGAVYTHGNQCAYIQHFEGISLKGSRSCTDCKVMNVSLMAMACTPTTVTVDLMVTGGNTSNHYTVKGSTGNSTGIYNQLSRFTCAHTGSLIMEIVDSADPKCTYPFEINSQICSAGRRRIENQGFNLNRFMNYAPNPANDELAIDVDIPMTRDITKSKILIIDMLGRVQLERQITDHRAKAYLDISHLENGVYMITLNMNGLLYSSKLVKESWK